MDLGNAVLRRSALNSLFRALHPRHGLVWTDGQNVFLSPVVIQNDSLKQSNPIKLGEFDSIQGLCWSCDFPGSWCYLCVTQYQKVSIWRVEGTTPNLKLKLVRKISKNPLPQGCLWNPVRDILAIATAEQCNIYFRHSDKKSSLSLPIQPQGRDVSQLRSACWSDLGDRLYVATKSTIWLFAWSSIDTKIKEFTGDEYPITGSEGNILTMVAIGRDYILLTKELPLEKLCADNGLSVDMTEAMKSPTNTLMNLGSGDSRPAAASLTLLAMTGDRLSTVSTTHVEGMLAPDLLCYGFDGTSQLVVVGSNTQSTLQFYTVSGLGTFDKQHDIILPDNQRPKGLCQSSVPQSVYILVGKTKKEDTAFLSLSKDSEYELKLNLTKLYPSDLLVHQNGAAGTSTQSALLTEPVSVSENNFKISNLPAAPPVIEELSPPPSTGTLPKVHNSATSNNQNMAEERESSLTRQLSSSQPHLGSAGNKQINQSDAMHSRNNQSASSLAGASQSNEEVNIGDERGDYSNNSGVKMQNNVNEEGRRIEARDSASSWRNITKSDESLIQNHNDSDFQSPRRIDEEEAPVTSSPAAPAVSSTISHHSDDHDVDSLARHLNSQEQTISRLRRRIDELSNMLEECHLISVNNYQDMNNPEVASIRFTSGATRQVSERKFLLDKGRLQLAVLKSAFNVPYLVLDLDGLPIVLTSNIDGYIPLKFEVGRTYHLTCDEAYAQGSTLISAGTRHQSGYGQSSGISVYDERAQPTGSRHVATESQTTQHQNNSIAAHGKTADKLTVIDPTHAKLKELIMSDKSGNAMRRLQAAATHTNGPSAMSGQPISDGVAGPTNTDDYMSRVLPGAEEPVKPPRRGVNKKANRSDDSGDGSTTFMDVTAAI